MNDFLFVFLVLSLQLNFTLGLGVYDYYKQLKSRGMK